MVVLTDTRRHDPPFARFPRCVLARILIVMTTDAARGATELDIDRDELVKNAMPLVGYCVTSVAARVPRHVRHDDLVSAGLLGLAQASKMWDPTRGVSFEHFARRRIEGALLDELRSRDWASRSARKDTRRLNVITEELTGRLGRAPETAEVAKELGVTHRDVERIRDDVRRSTVLHLDAFEPGTGGSDSLADEPSSDPINQLLGQEMRGYLRDAVLTLPERLQKVVVEYFFEDRPMKEIAEDLGVTISRVSQLRGEAIAMLRDGINAQFEADGERPATPKSAGERKKADYYAAISSASDFATRVSASAPTIPLRVAAAG